MTGLVALGQPFARCEPCGTGFAADAALQELTRRIEAARVVAPGEEAPVSEVAPVVGGWEAFHDEAAAAPPAADVQEQRSAAGTRQVARAGSGAELEFEPIDDHEGPLELALPPPPPTPIAPPVAPPQPLPMAAPTKVRFARSASRPDQRPALALILGIEAGLLLLAGLLVCSVVSPEWVPSLAQRLLVGPLLLDVPWRASLLGLWPPFVAWLLVAAVAGALAAAADQAQDGPIALSAPRFGLAAALPFTRLFALLSIAGLLGPPLAARGARGLRRLVASSLLLALVAGGAAVAARLFDAVGALPDGLLPIALAVELGLQLLALLVVGSAALTLRRFTLVAPPEELDPSPRALPFGGDFPGRLADRLGAGPLLPVSAALGLAVLAIVPATRPALEPASCRDAARFVPFLVERRPAVECVGVDDRPSTLVTFDLEGRERGRATRTVGVPDGPALEKDARGRLRVLRSWRRGLEEGPSRTWDETGALTEEVWLRAGHRDGPQHRLEGGRLTETTLHEVGRELFQRGYHPNGRVAWLRRLGAAGGGPAEVRYGPDGTLEFASAQGKPLDAAAAAAFGAELHVAWLAAAKACLGRVAAPPSDAVGSPARLTRHAGRSAAAWGARISALRARHARGELPPGLLELTIARARRNGIDEGQLIESASAAEAR